MWTISPNTSFGICIQIGYVFEQQLLNNLTNNPIKTAVESYQMISNDLKHNPRHQVTKTMADHPAAVGPVKLPGLILN